MGVLWGPLARSKLCSCLSALACVRHHRRCLSWTHACWPCKHCCSAARCAERELEQQRQAQQQALRLAEAAPEAASAAAAALQQIMGAAAQPVSRARAGAPADVQPVPVTAPASTAAPAAMPNRPAARYQQKALQPCTAPAPAGLHLAAAPTADVGAPAAGPVSLPEAHAASPGVVPRDDAHTPAADCPGGPALEPGSVLAREAETARPAPPPQLAAPSQGALQPAPAQPAGVSLPGTQQTGFPPESLGLPGSLGWPVQVPAEAQPVGQLQCTSAAAQPQPGTPLDEAALRPALAGAWAAEPSALQQQHAARQAQAQQLWQQLPQAEQLRPSGPQHLPPCSLPQQREQQPVGPVAASSAGRPAPAAEPQSLAGQQGAPQRQAGPASAAEQPVQPAAGAQALKAEPQVPGWPAPGQGQAAVPGLPPMDPAQPKVSESPAPFVADAHRRCSDAEHLLTLSRCSARAQQLPVGPAP